MAENFSPNERIGIAADNAVSRDDIVGADGAERTESIVGIALRIVGKRRCCMMPGDVGSLMRQIFLRVRRGLEGDQHNERDRRQERQLGNGRTYITSP